MTDSKRKIKRSKRKKKNQRKRTNEKINVHNVDSTDGSLSDPESVYSNRGLTTLSSDTSSLLAGRTTIPGISARSVTGAESVFSNNGLTSNGSDTSSLLTGRTTIDGLSPVTGAGSVFSNNGLTTIGSDTTSLLTGRTTIDGLSPVTGAGSVFSNNGLTTIGTDTTSLLTGRTTIDGLSPVTGSVFSNNGLTTIGSDTTSLLTGRTTIDGLSPVTGAGSVFSDNVLTTIGSDTSSITVRGATLGDFSGKSKITVGSLDILSREVNHLDDNYFISSSGLVNSESGSWEILNTFDYNDKKKQRDELNSLEEKVKKLTDSLKKEQGNNETIKAELRAALLEHDKINDLIYLEKKVHAQAYHKIKNDEDFYKLFNSNSNYVSAIISIDIRRSTDLMLQAKTPLLYTDFISNLSEKLKMVILSNFGIFDKFTGDGILAYFPIFYTGENSLMYSLKAAQECHEIFKKHYDENRSIFNVAYSDTGLGIGIDYGESTITTVTGELTIVGTPVVYACRLSTAPAGTTYVNQSVVDNFEKNDKVTFTENTIEIKHEGKAFVYSPSIDWNSLDLQVPEWYSS